MMRLHSGERFETYAAVHVIIQVKVSRKCFLAKTDRSEAQTFYAFMKVFIKP